MTLPAISSDMSVGELAERIARRDPAVSKHEGLLILDANRTSRASSLAATFCEHLKKTVTAR